MKLVIVIDGESANELFAVGPTDLRKYFLPKGLGIESSDIAKIHFEDVKERDDYGLPVWRTKHKDNYTREKS